MAVSAQLMPAPSLNPQAFAEDHRADRRQRHEGQQGTGHYGLPERQVPHDPEPEQGRAGAGRDAHRDEGRNGREATIGGVLEEEITRNDDWGADRDEAGAACHALDRLGPCRSGYAGCRAMMGSAPLSGQSWCHTDECLVARSAPGVLGQEIGIVPQASKAATAGAAPASETENPGVLVNSIAAVLSDRPFSTLPKPLSVTLRVLPSADRV